MNQERVVTLGGKEYEIAPIDLGTLKKIGVGSRKAQIKKPDDPAAEEAAWYDGTYEALAAALGKTKPEIEALKSVTFDELIASITTVYELSGLATKKPQKEAGGATTGNADTAAAKTAA